MPSSRTLSTPLTCRLSIQRRTSTTDSAAISAMPVLSNFTLRACRFSRAPWQAGQASSATSSTSGSAKVCSRPLLSSACTVSSKALRCSRVSLTPVPTHSGHQPCLLL